MYVGGTEPLKAYFVVVSRHLLGVTVENNDVRMACPGADV
jgi:hypothetical protein